MSNSNAVLVQAPDRGCKRQMTCVLLISQHLIIAFHVDSLHQQCITVVLRQQQVAFSCALKFFIKPIVRQAVLTLDWKSPANNVQTTKSSHLTPTGLHSPWKIVCRAAAFEQLTVIRASCNLLSLLMYIKAGWHQILPRVGQWLSSTGNGSGCCQVPLTGTCSGLCQHYCYWSQQDKRAQHMRCITAKSPQLCYHALLSPVTELLLTSEKSTLNST